MCQFWNIPWTFIFLYIHDSEFLEFRDMWVAQLVKHLRLAQVMIPRFYLLLPLPIAPPACAQAHTHTLSLSDKIFLKNVLS